MEFDEWFASEADCEDFLRRLRWPEGFYCPGCGAAGGWETSRGLFRCSSCARQTSVTAGTLFEGTRKPLRLWFQAMWYFTNQKHGVSALGLQRILGLGSYQTAWAWLHKFRRAMVRPRRDLLSGEVEVDETFLGGRDSDIDGRETDRSLIAIAVEIRGRGIGRIRMARLDDASADSLIPFVKSTVSEGALVCTDGWAGYLPLSRHGYQHRPTSLRATGLPAQVVMAGVHRVASLLSEALVVGYVPRRHQQTAPRRLPQRVHLPVQPANISSSRPPLLSPRPAGGPDGRRSLPSDPGR